MRPRQERHISKFIAASAGWDGYWVRLRNKNDVPGYPAQPSKTFPLSSYNNDWDKALRAAKRWRNSTMKALGYLRSGTLVGPGYSHLATKARTRKRGKDIELPVGVSHVTNDRLDGGQSCAYKATISPAPLEIMNKQFGYDPNKPGDKEKSLRKAKKTRKDWEKKYYAAK